MPNPELLELEIEGMTCTACARRVEKTLNKVDGVSAYVDFATEKAHLQLNVPVELGVLKAAVESAGYHVGSGKPELQKLKPRLYTGVVLSLVAMLIGMVPWFAFAGMQYALWALTTPVFFYVAFPFHQAAIKNLRHLDTTMDTLVSLGSAVAYFYSIYLVLIGDMHQYFEVSAVVPTVVLIGRYIEVRARRSATDAVRSMLSAVPETSTVQTVDGNKQVPTSQIKKGDVVLIAAGERIPVDGKLITSSALIDNSTLTGESLPQEIRSGEILAAGATSVSGQIAIEAVGTSSTSRIARIADLVREATSQKTQLGSLTDRISSVFVPSVIVIAIATYVIQWLITNDSNFAFSAAVAVLVIACPCALGIAVPMSLVVATSLGAKRSVIIRNPDSLRLMAKVTKIFFDKTGTVTDGQLRVVNSRGLGGVGAATMLSYAAAIEAGSKHPVAKAIANLSDHDQATNIKELPGIGLSGIVDGKEIFVTKPGSYENQEELDQAISNAGPNTLVVVSWEGWAHGLIELSDQIRPGAAQALQDVKAMGFETVLLSGDNAVRVGVVARELGFDDFIASVTPEKKLETIKSQTEVSAMIGDGINDVAALSAADISIAMGSGSQAAQAASSITILDDDPRAIPYALKLAKRTHRNILQNLAWAFGYNLLLIPVAALGLLNPMLAGAAMAFSSVSVVANSMRLRWQNSSR